MSIAKFNSEGQMRFRSALKDAGLNQKEFCKAAGLGESTLKLAKAGGSFSQYTKNRIVEILNEKLKARAKKPITAAWLYQHWQARPSSRQNNILPEVATFQVQATRSKTSIEGADLPDLLTPGVSTAQICEIYTHHTGARVAKQLQEHSTAAILAVENGDFEAQTKIGNQLAEAAADIPCIRGVGLYFAGEGFRLLADLEKNLSKRKTLHERATVKYQQASQLLPADPRPVRGLARIQELKELFDDATEGFLRAEGLVLVSKSQRGNPHKKPFLNHEHLRVIRHKIHCFLDLRDKSPTNVWNREHKTQELHGLVVECDNLHNELMAPFHGRQRWWQIEWFMGLVFLAKAWGHLKQKDRLFLCLLHALSIRRDMFIDSRDLSDVERANLSWWVEVGLSFREFLGGRFVSSVEKLQAALLEKNDIEAVIEIDELVRLIRPPGEREF